MWIYQEQNFLSGIVSVNIKTGQEENPVLQMLPQTEICHSQTGKNVLEWTPQISPESDKIKFVNFKDLFWA